MVKKIKYALTMADGAKVRTLEDLRDHFDWPHVLGYFLDGKLAEWLRDRYFDELAASVESLSAESPDLEQQLCHLLGVAWEAKETTVDVTRMQRRQEMLKLTPEERKARIEAAMQEYRKKFG